MSFFKFKKKGLSLLLFFLLSPFFFSCDFKIFNPFSSMPSNVSFKIAKDKSEFGFSKKIIEQNENFIKNTFNDAEKKLALSEKKNETIEDIRKHYRSSLIKEIYDFINFLYRNLQSDEFFCFNLYVAPLISYDYLGSYKFKNFIKKTRTRLFEKLKNKVNNDFFVAMASDEKQNYTSNGRFFQYASSTDSFSVQINLDLVRDFKCCFEIVTGSFFTIFFKAICEILTANSEVPINFFVLILFEYLINEATFFEHFLECLFFNEDVSIIDSEKLGLVKWAKLFFKNLKDKAEKVAEVSQHLLIAEDPAFFRYAISKNNSEEEFKNFRFSKEEFDRYVSLVGNDRSYSIEEYKKTVFSLKGYSKIVEKIINNFETFRAKMNNHRPPLLKLYMLGFLNIMRSLYKIENHLDNDEIEKIKFAV